MPLFRRRRSYTRPAYKTSRRYRTRSKPRRRFGYRKRPARRTVARMGKNMRDSTFVKLSFWVRIATTVSGLSQVVLRANGLFDPGEAASSDNAYGQFVWSYFYQRYRCHGSKIQLWINNLDTADSRIVNVFPTPNSNLWNHGFQSEANQPYTTTKFLTPLSGSRSSCYIKKYMSTKKMFGVSNISDDSYQALLGSDPSRQWYWTILSNDFDDTGGQVEMIAKVTYYCELFDRDILAVS